jgi:hypothetical protein
MPVPSAITDLSTSAAGNSPAGSDTVFPSLDDYIRALSAFIAQNYASIATKQASLGYTPVNKAGDTLTGVLAATKGTAALPGIAFSGDTNTGIHSSGADILDLVTAGVAQWRVDASGRLLCAANKQPCFRGTTSAARTTTGQFATYSAETDAASNFDASAGTFLTPVAGWYEFAAHFWHTFTPSAAEGSIDSYIYVNSPSVSAAQQRHIHTALVTTTTASLHTGPIYLASGVTVSANCSNATFVSGTPSYQCLAFSGRLLG